jgi:hypothetical protein
MAYFDKLLIEVERYLAVLFLLVVSRYCHYGSEYKAFGR